EQTINGVVDRYLYAGIEPLEPGTVTIIAEGGDCQKCVWSTSLYIGSDDSAGGGNTCSGCGGGAGSQPGSMTVGDKGLHVRFSMGTTRYDFQHDAISAGDIWFSADIPTAATTTPAALQYNVPTAEGG